MTMRVIMAGVVSGTRDGQDWPKVGESIDLPADEAASLIAAGIAVAAPTKAVAETAAVAPKAETAAAAKPSARKAVKE